MSQDPKERNEFQNFDDTPGNNGWTGNSILDEPRYREEENEEIEDEDSREIQENSFTVDNGNDSFACINDFEGVNLPDNPKDDI